ncbi:YhbY family RNA-binding protein [candidate division KSB1 bacterium]|nr:YhbY family RNA-binding protein [candidate division KSB1 bacterium]
MELRGLHRRYLRGLANRIKPVVQIGKAGLSQAVFSAIDEALTDHELIKIRFLEFKQDKKSLCAEIAETCHCHHVGLTGHTALFYRSNPDAEKRHIVLPDS